MTGPWEDYQQAPKVAYSATNPAYAGATPTPAQQAYALAHRADPSAAPGSPGQPYYSATNSDVPAGASYVDTSGQPQQAQPVFSADATAGPWSNFAPRSSIPLGLLKGVEKPLDNAASGLEGLLAAVGVPTARIDQALGMPSAQEANANQASYFDKMRQQGVVPNKGAEIAGNIAGTLPVAVENPWLAGAASGALLSDSHTPGGIAGDAALGAVGGKVGQMALNGVGAVVRPQVNAAVQKLIDAGVRLTPGQIMGKGGIGGQAVKAAEDVLTGIPIAGGVAQGARRRSIDTLNRAATNRVLEPLGETLPSDVQTGHDAVAYAGNAVSAKYQSVLPHVQMTADQNFADDLAAMHEDISTLAPDKAQQLASILQNNVFNKFSPGSTIDGEVWKRVDTKLGQIATRYGKAPDPDQQQFGDIVRGVQGVFRDTLARQNPAYAPDLDAANAAWSNLVRIERASGSTAAEDGVFSPTQLHQAVKAGDSSVRSRAFSRGEAQMQDLSSAAKSVLPSKIPDSGTTGRGLVSMLALGGGGAAAHAPFAPALAAAATLPYTPLGQRLAQAALTQRPDWTATLSDLLAKLKAPAGVAGASLAVGAQNGGLTPAQ